MKFRIVLLIFLPLLFTACLGKQAATPELTTNQTQTAPLTVTPAITPTMTLEDTPPPFTEVPAASPMPTQVLESLPRLAADLQVKINSLQMFPDGTGWALGGELDLPTQVLYTQDHARSWSDRTPPEPAPLPGSPAKTAVAFFFDSQHAWVTFAPPDPLESATQPVVWRTSDGGSSWQPSEVLQNASLSEVYQPSLFFFSDLQHGWLMSHHGAAAGHTPVSIHQTRDGGQTWQIVAQPMDEVSYPLHTCCQSGMLFFEDHATGLVAREAGPIPLPHVLRTTDGGVTWEQQDLPAPEPGLYESFYCGTQSLQRLSGKSASFVMNCMEFEPEGIQRAFVYLTSDLGASWSWKPLPKPAWPAEWVHVRSVSEVQWLTTSTGWLFVMAYYELPNSTEGNNATQIYQTRDGGISWEARGLTYWRGQFTFTSASDGFAIARSGLENALVFTQNGGLNWSMLEPVTQ